jgi:hypothetical protein
MSNTRYLELSSTYRDRNLWPLPSQFEVEVSQSGTRDRFSARDPVSTAATFLQFTGSFRMDTPSNSIAISAVLSALPVTNISDPQTLTIQATATRLWNLDDFYNGAVLSLTDGTTTARRRIVNYTWLYTDTAQVTVSAAFPDALIATGVTGTITNGSVFNASVPVVFIPTGLFIDNYYAGLQLYDVNIQEYRTIVSYDGTTHLAYLDAIAASWASTDQFIIMKAKPTSAGVLKGVNGQYIGLDPTTALNQTTGYLNSFLRTLNTLPIVVTVPAAPFGVERKITQYTALDSTLTAVSGTTFTFGSEAVATDNYYTNMFFTTALGNTYLITAYTGATRSGTTSAAITDPVSSIIYIRTAILAPLTGTQVNPAVGDYYQIELFSYDNYHPFTYSGSMVSQSQQVCYEIELLNISLPNITLKAGRGGRIAFYPYVYVQLQSVSNPCQDIIYSNNPHAGQMLFHATIDDIPNPLIASFLKVDGDGMKQVIKFKPNEALRLSVHLPGGELFITETNNDELFSPSAANDLNQISALFSLKRL